MRSDHKLFTVSSVRPDARVLAKTNKASPFVSPNAGEAHSSSSVINSFVIESKLPHMAVLQQSHLSINEKWSNFTKVYLKKKKKIVEKMLNTA